MPRHMRHDEASTHSLAKEFNTEFNTVKRILEKQGVKPKRVIKAGHQTMIDWPKTASRAAIQAYLNERKAKEEAAQAEAEAALRKAEELVQQRTKELAASVSNSVRIQNNTITPPAGESLAIKLPQNQDYTWPSPGSEEFNRKDDGPNYAAVAEELDTQGLFAKLDKIETLMNQILDAITTPQGEPK